MGKLLEELAKIDKRNGIKKAHQVAPEDVASYVDTQIAEMQKIILRNRVDILLNEQIECRTKAEEAARDNKVREMEATTEQLVDAVNVLTKLSDEL